ncbi:hypothetical protein D9757_014985 [Collybiopsis confluens]|uniref:PWWP domain-containing protein n=1 Tax=Collybiopsis confluens TaxID=2823264 RepID=A0A8H5CEB9_9AGAR|nr:hypothetical protein D9757_014985 [Collybiopsis confluens]
MTKRKNEAIDTDNTKKPKADMPMEDHEPAYHLKDGTPKNAETFLETKVIRDMVDMKIKVHFVKWLGWGPEHNSWIADDDRQDEPLADPGCEREPSQEVVIQNSESGEPRPAGNMTDMQSQENTAEVALNDGTLLRNRNIEGEASENDLEEDAHCEVKGNDAREEIDGDDKVVAEGDDAEGEDAEGEDAEGEDAEGEAAAGDIKEPEAEEVDEEMAEEPEAEEEDEEMEEEQEEGKTEAQEEENDGEGSEEESSESEGGDFESVHVDRIGAIVLVKFKGSPDWPARVVNQARVPRSVLKVRHTQKPICVQYFPDGEFDWKKQSELRLVKKNELQQLICNGHGNRQYIAGLKNAMRPKEWSRIREVMILNMNLDAEQ